MLLLLLTPTLKKSKQIFAVENAWEDYKNGAKEIERETIANQRWLYTVLYIEINVQMEKQYYY